MGRIAWSFAAIAILACAIAPPLAAAELGLPPPIDVAHEPALLTAMKALATAGAALIVLVALVSAFDEAARWLARAREGNGSGHGDSRKWRWLRRSLLGTQPAPHMRC